ncbi:MAG TPA: ATP-dependent carboxylate-amine ligase [Mycobacteriales bacterium]|nr:ATP-dependent carboxylate-amine ligase [Mycobacteriales bacterium]
MILVISASGDLHARVVLDALAGLGEPAHLVDLSTFPTRMTLTGAYQPDDAPRFRLCLADGSHVPLDEVRSVWWRRPQPYGVPATITDPVLRSFALSETSTAFAGMWQTTDCLWVNDIGRDTAAAHKPWQLALARQAGLTIPETLVTNDPDEARAFWSDHPGRVVYKPFLQTHAAWRETRVLRKEEEALAESVRLAPVMFQEWVPGAADLRVTVIGDEVFPAAAPLDGAAYDVDVRFNDVRYETHDLPDDVSAALLRLMDELGLEYGAIDLRLTPDGGYVFFEVNPAGQFLYVEQATGQPITAALAAHLRSGKPARGVA